MEDAARENCICGSLGIGHMRWATHCGVTEPNAHPHISGGMIAVVHNGIIENFESERKRLEDLGYRFESQTDTEVIAHSINHEYAQNGGRLFEAVQEAVKRFHGAYAIAVIAQDKPDELVVARMGCRFWSLWATMKPLSLRTYPPSSPLRAAWRTSKTATSRCWLQTASKG